MSDWLNLVAVPEGGGAPRRWRVSVFWLKVGVIAFSVLMLAVLFGSISYTGLLFKAATYNNLEEENQRLQEENHKILAVADELRQSRELLAQIIRALGGHLQLSNMPEGSTPAPVPPIAAEKSEKATKKGRAETARASAEPVTIPLEGNYTDTTASFGASNTDVYDIPSKLPVNGFISQGFLIDRLFPARSHRGIDIAGKMGEPIVAAATGRVVFEGWTPTFGYFILMSHPNGYVTFYGHNQYNIKKIDQEVKRGEPLALLGNSGRSTAPHLHFEIWRDGEPMDPQEFIAPD